MKTLKWGLIGAGDIAKKRVAPALADLANCELIAVSRRNAELVEEFAETFGVRKRFSDWRELIADAEVEAVYLATPVHLHGEQAIAAARAGKHVLCEKPLAMNPVECARMIDAARDAGVKLGVAYYRHFYPVVRRVKQIIEAGEIGAVAVAQMNAFEYFDPAPDNPRRWLLEKSKSGGGPMMDFGCHRLEVLTNLFGAVARVESLSSDAVFRREVEDTATAVLQFESGSCAVLTVTHAAAEPQDTLDIFGTKGSIHAPVLNRGELKVIAGGGTRDEYHPPHPNLHQPLIEDFADAVLQNRSPIVGGETGRTVAELTARILG